MHIIRSGLYSFLVICIFISLSGFRWLNEDYMVNAFEEIALKSEYRTGQSEPVRKWVKPVYIFVDSRIGYSRIQDQLVDQHIAHLNRLIDHPISRTADKNKANMLILFEHSSKAYQSTKAIFPEKPPFSVELLQNSVCIVQFHTKSNGEIYKAFVLIPPDKARAFKKLPACVVEEITQGLGLPNDSEQVYPSVFNDKSIDDDLSPLDELLLQILYDKRIKIGMSREKVKPVVREILREKLPGLKKRYKNLIRYEQENPY